MKNCRSESHFRGSIIVWRLGGFGHIFDAEYGFRKKISAVYGFSVVTWLQKNRM